MADSEASFDERRSPYFDARWWGRVFGIAKIAGGVKQWAGWKTAPMMFDTFDDTKTAYLEGDNGGREERVQAKLHE